MPYFIFFLALIAFACDGKPPDFVDKKISKPLAASEKSEENGNALLNEKWTKNPMWQSETTELAEYAVERILNNTAVKFKETRLTRKELFSRQTYSASNDTARKDLVAVISQHTRGVSDKIQYGTSVAVLEREPIRTAKFIAHWVSEFSTYTKTLRRLVGRTMLYVHSWQMNSDGKGDDELDLGKNDFLEDQIPLSLRSLNFQIGKEFYWNTLLEVNAPNSEKPLAVEMNYKIQSIDTISVSAGKFACWKVSISSGERETAYWFEVAAPNIMVKAQTDVYSAELLSRKYLNSHK